MSFKHEEAALLLSDFVMGDLDAERELALRQHLAECEACRDELRLILKMRGLLSERGRELLEEHPPSRHLVSLVTDDAGLAAEDLATLALHLRVCSACREAVELLRKSHRRIRSATSRRGYLWLAAAALVLAFALLYPAQRGLFDREPPVLQVSEGEVLRLHEPGEAPSEEVPILALARDLSHLPLSIAWQPNGDPGLKLDLQLCSLPEREIVWSHKATAASLFNANRNELNVLVPANLVRSGTFELRVVSGEDSSLIEDYLFRLRYGGASKVTGGAVIESSDGGCVVAGETLVFGQGDADGWLVKTDADGQVLWSKSYGGRGWEGFRNIARARDGGYVLTGFAGGEFAKLWLLHVDEGGEIIWDRRFGTDRAWDNGHQLVQTRDGGWAVIGYTCSYGPGPHAIYLVRTDEMGRRTWQKTFGSEWNDKGQDLLETEDGGFLLLGSSHRNGVGTLEAVVIRTDSAGDLLWERHFGSRDANETRDGGSCLIPGPGNGVYVVGYSEHGQPGDFSSWLRLLDRDGALLWTRKYDDAAFGKLQNGRALPGGELALVGMRARLRGEETNYWLLRTDAEGRVLESFDYGGQEEDKCLSMAVLSSGGILLSGTTESWGTGNSDLWLLRTDEEGHWDPAGCGGSCWSTVLSNSPKI